jgi:hypothetical protein
MPQSVINDLAKAMKALRKKSKTAPLVRIPASFQFMSRQAAQQSPSWLSWYGVTLVALTDCRWWFDSPLVRE